MFVFSGFGLVGRTEQPHAEGKAEGRADKVCRDIGAYHISYREHGIGQEQHGGDHHSAYKAYGIRLELERVSCGYEEQQRAEYDTAQPRPAKAYVLRR